ncbi:protein ACCUMULATION AND REPLICATION OF CHLOROPLASTS 6, chloroplastic [Physcomitrium patens]|uniref:Uncharacterized protein n=1 Tax=Physcomitrium patens TaxID=3218 RepID=A0A2K1IQB4_PHYPA|nr:protein ACCUMULATION AND REPLICATION OF CHLOROPLASTS 6, chloroplastic-like [Physcomitrium patens]PNR31466.1 hypothetical protein PHYPA_025587 [Physcomitrium patens]|eukprot:XP_024359405.1 protein ACCUMULATION AND REPLICATION OF CHLOROPLASTS 6, chloroplastic-like [Physcomitrella patens]
MLALDCVGVLALRHGQGGAGLLQRLGVERPGVFAQLGRVWMGAVVGARVGLGKGWRGRSTSTGVETLVRGTNRVSGRGRGRNSRVEKVRVQAVASAYPPIAQTEKTFRLPIDYYQILGAEPQYLADAIVRAFDSRIDNSPRLGFSQQALLARLEILRGARDSLVDPEIRAEYNQGLAEDEADTLILDVPLTKVGGALCLLHEVGEVEVVLQAGQALLAQQEDLPKTLNRDVVLAMALSYVELSREAMAESPPAVVKSCSLLESALKLLREEGGRNLATDLQEQIEGTLDELSARCILELLSLSLDKEYEPQRQQGLEGLRSLLWSVDEDGNSPPLGGLTREQLMKEAFSLMTAAEQVALFTDTPSNIPADSSEVYSAALAYVAEGFVSKSPRLIQEADALFLQLQQADPSLADGETSNSPEFSFERGICALLLGEVADCRAWLGLEDEKSPLRDPSVVNFVYSYSEEGEENDSLPGLCKLLEGWLTEMVFPRCRDTESLRFKLTDYFDDPSVLSYLEGLEKGNGSHMAAAAAIVRIGAGAGAALNNVKATLKRVFPMGRSSESTTTSDVLDNPDELPRREYHKGADGDARSPSLNSIATGFEDENWEGSEVVQDEGNSVKDTKSPHNVPVRGSLGFFQIACGGLVLGALMIAGLRYLPLKTRPAHALKPSTPTVSSTGVRRTEALEVEVVPKMDARLAEIMVRRWQAAKARALGSAHDMAALPEVLEGEMLKSWTDRVSDVKRNGWFWEYTLLGLHIDSVTVSDDGRRATAEATLQEAARLVDRNNPDHNDSYRSTYTTRYDLRHGIDGWRINGGAVLRT